LSRGLRVGITVWEMPEEAAEAAVWSCGATQNFILLYSVLQQLPFIRDLMFVTPAGAPCAIAAPRYLGVTPRVVSYAEELEHLDVLIELGANVSPENVQTVRANGGKVITYRIGPDYQVMVEAALFGDGGSSISAGWSYDGIWLSPHYEHVSGPLLETCFRCPLQVVPHIWDSRFLDYAVAHLQAPHRFGYQPSEQPKRIGIFESNVGVYKTAHVPLVICEQAYRRDPDKIKAIFACNTSHLKGRPSFADCFGRLDIVKQGIAWFETRHQFGPFMAEYADIVVSHQWCNELNYLYYDALHGGYPLIHNSPPLKHLGYYYEGFEVHDGCDALLRAIAEHDRNLPDYRAAAAEFLATVAPTHPNNVAAFSEALLALCSD